MGSTTFRKRDLSRYMRVYPFVRRTPRYEYVADKPTRIEIEKLVFTNSSEVSYTFRGGSLPGGGYSSVPIVTATSVEIAASSPQGADVNVYVTAVSQYAVTLESSHSFTGEVHIQIMWIGTL